MEKWNWEERFRTHASEATLVLLHSSRPLNTGKGKPFSGVLKKGQVGGS